MDRTKAGADRSADTRPGDAAQTGAARLVRPELLALLGYEPIVPVDVLAKELGIPLVHAQPAVGEHVSEHRAIRIQWRLKQALGRTWLRRPDLLAARKLNDEERGLLDEFQRERGENGK